MFNAVAPTYDLVNRVATWGFDERWRRAAAAECLASRPRRVLDIGCGTGDLIINVARRAKGGVELMGLDYSPRMLAIARRKGSTSSPATWPVCLFRSLLRLHRHFFCFPQLDL